MGSLKTVERGRFSVDPEEVDLIGLFPSDTVNERVSSSDTRETRRFETHFPTDSNTFAYSSYNAANFSAIPFANKNL